ncbi:two-component response regulator ARR14-like isoform X2 [Populus trichocarpa]|nr:two-component response regulator ARR14-like isoform X2 [Populus trichocarpa]
MYRHLKINAQASLSEYLCVCLSNYLSLSLGLDYWLYIGTSIKAHILYLQPKHLFLSLSVCVCLIISFSLRSFVPNMTSERVLSVEVTENNAGSFPIGVRILVVESDPTCLRIVSKMLQAFGYEVTTATRATDALHILREKEDEINLILIETRLPDMNQYEILETLGELSSLPIVVFSADNNESAMLGCLYKGAALYLMKPIIKNDVKNLWQLTYRTKIKTAVSGKGSNSFHGGSSEEKASSVTAGNPSSTMGMTDQKGKRKELEETNNDDEDNNNLTVPKKRKLVWTNELHNRFLQAIRILGIDGAHPKKILQHMNVPGLKKENVSSHLQKYRLYLKREQDAMLKTMIRDCHPSSTFNLQGGFSQYTNSQFFMTASQSEYGNNFQNNLCSPMSVHSLGSVHSPTHVKSNYNGILIPNYGQVASQSKQLYRSYPNSNHTEIRTTTDGNFSSFGQKGNHSVEERLNQGTTLSNIGTHGPTFLGNSQQQVQFPLPQPQPLPEKEDESDILDIATVEELELLVMQKEFLEDPNNDLW